MNYKIYLVGLLSFVFSGAINAASKDAEKAPRVQSGLVVKTYNERGVVVERAHWALSAAGAHAFVPKGGRSGTAPVVPPPPSAVIVSSGYAARSSRASSGADGSDIFDLDAVYCPGPTPSPGFTPMSTPMSTPRVTPVPCWAGHGSLHHSASAPSLAPKMLPKTAVHRPYTAPDAPTMSLRDIIAAEEEMKSRSSVSTPRSVMVTPTPKATSPLDTLKSFVSGLPADSAGTKILHGAWVDQWGGHTYFEHVGKSNTYLKGRLALRGKDIEAASTFTDIGTAEEVLQEVLVAKSSQIAVWLASAKQGDRLTLSGAHASRIGCGYFPANPTKVRTSMSCVVLSCEKTSPTGYVVFTAYPFI